VYLGSLNHYYDLTSIAIQISKHYSTLKVPLHIYGDGPLFSVLQNIAKNKNGIVLHGRYNNNDIGEFINSPNDILIVPYKSGTIAEIGSPTKLFEYMSLKCPIIASNVGQSKYIIKHQETGYIYESPSEMIQIIKTLSNDFNNRQLIGELAFDDLLLNHTWTKRMQSLIKIIEND
jgi:glycosyltransferase involved in cell wall biosynthesis